MNNFEIFRRNKDFIKGLVKRGVISTTHYSYYLMYIEYLRGKHKKDIAIDYSVSLRTIDRAVQFMES